MHTHVIENKSFTRWQIVFTIWSFACFLCNQYLSKRRGYLTCWYFSWFVCRYLWHCWLIDLASHVPANTWRISSSLEFWRDHFRCAGEFFTVLMFCGSFWVFLSSLGTEFSEAASSKSALHIQSSKDIESYLIAAQPIWFHTSRFCSMEDQRLTKWFATDVCEQDGSDEVPFVQEWLMLQINFLLEQEMLDFIWPSEDRWNFIIFIHNSSMSDVHSLMRRFARTYACASCLHESCEQETHISKEVWQYLPPKSMRSPLLRAKQYSQDYALIAFLRECCWSLALLSHVCITQKTLMLSGTL